MRQKPQFQHAGQVLEVNIATRHALFAEVAARLTDRRGFALATVNLDHLVKHREDPAFRDAYAAHDLVVADGNPIVWLSRLARRPVELVPGSDVVLPLAQIAADTGVPVALLGATSEVLAAAANHIITKVPGIQIVARLAPSGQFDPIGPEADDLIGKLATSGASMTFLALGAPRQEIFAARARAELPDMGFVSIGAGLDFLAGTQKRAPAWLRKLALEWLWRLSLSPKRLTLRYAKCAIILPSLIIAAWRQRKDV